MNSFYVLGEIVLCNKNYRLLDVEGVLDIKLKDSKDIIKVYLEEALLNKLEESLVFDELLGSFCGIQGTLKASGELTKLVAQKLTLLSKKDLSKKEE